jgi:hypothetical protein
MDWLYDALSELAYRLADKGRELIAGISHCSPGETLRGLTSGVGGASRTVRVSKSSG